MQLDEKNFFIIRSRMLEFLRSIFSPECIEDVKFTFSRTHPFFICWDIDFTFPVLEVRQDALVLETIEGTIFHTPYKEDYAFAFCNPEE